MTSRIASWLTVCSVMMLLPAVASATPGQPTSGVHPGVRQIHLVPPLQLADVEVVNQPPATAPAPVAVTPPAQPVVVTPPPVHREVVRHHESSFMSTIAINAVMGAVAGGLIGGALYYLNDNRTHAQRIVYWAAGGVLVGAGVGVVQIMVEENHSETVARLPSDPARTHRLALLTTHF